MKNLSVVLFSLIVVSVQLTMCDKIQKPCANGLTLDCVKDFFSKNGKCKLREGNEEKDFKHVEIPVYVPVSNLTVFIKTANPANLGDSNIEELFLNKTSGNLVMSLNYHGFYCQSPDSLIAVHQLGKEPKVFSENLNISRPVVLTAVMPVNPEDGSVTTESLEKATYSAYFPDNDLYLNAGPKFSESEDPDVSATFQSMIANIQTVFDEVFLTKASYYFLWYLQSYICDYGVLPNLQYKLDPSVFQRIADGNKEGPKEESIKKPCGQGGDLAECAKGYFKEHATCSVISKPDNSPLHRPQYKVETPWVNLTALVTDAEVTGLDGKIIDLSTNDATGNLLITVQFDSIHMYSPAVPLYIHQKGAEPKVVTDFNKDTYPCTLTAVIPTDGEITQETMKKAFVTPYFTSTVGYDVGSDQSESEDPEISGLITKLANDPTTHAAEMFVTEAPKLFLAYLQKYICDFSLPIDP